MTKIMVCFPGGKHKALAMSYDDGVVADRRLVSLFNRYGIKGTFHLNAGLLGIPGRLTAEEAQELYKGHEVSAHSLTHPTMARCPREQIVHEIMEDRKRLEELFGYTVRGMSYPNGSFSGEIKQMLPMLGVEYARVVQSTGSFAMPEDWHEWKPTCHHNDHLLERTESFLALHKSQYLYLMYVWGHSYEFDHDSNWELIERFCELAGGHDSIWYASSLDIADYMAAFNRLKFSAGLQFAYNPSAQSMWLNVDQTMVEIKGGSQMQLV